MINKSLFVCHKTKRELVLHTMSRRRHMSKEQKRQAFYTQSPEEVLKSVEATEQEHARLGEPFQSCLCELSH